MRRFFTQILLILSAPAVLGGCGGYYTLTVPDQLATAGQDAVTVARLQRNDFIFTPMPVPDAAMRMSVAGYPMRAAYTDEQGYGGTSVVIPANPGRYKMTVAHLDREGEDVSATVPLYVWDSGRMAVAVDLDDVLDSSQAKADQIRVALNRIAADANILYLTRREIKDHPALHERIAEIGHPDGPILSWRRQRWAVIPGGKLGFRIVIESRLVSQLTELRKQFAGLEVGVCDSSLAARAFTEAGLEARVIGEGTSWSDLAERGL